MKVAIFGAGTMGSGIAQVFAAKGHTALMYASSVASAQKHKDKLAASLQKRVEKGKMTQEAVDALMANILVEEKSACADADLIIECVKEDMATKRELLGELDAMCKPEAIFASNTSSLSITEMGHGLKHPVIGMHFFNPVPSMKLVEIIRGANTTQETFDFIYKLTQEIGRPALPPWLISTRPCSWVPTIPWAPWLWAISSAWMCAWPSWRRSSTRPAIPSTVPLCC